MSINAARGLWICYAGCGQGTIPSLISRYLGITEIEASTYGIEPSLSLRVRNNDTHVVPQQVQVEELGVPNRVPKWIFGRGFTKETLLFWGCRENENALVIPINDKNKNLIGYTERKPEGVLPKYKYTNGSKISQTLFGIDKLPANTPLVCVTEGPLDTMWLWQCGFDSVALLGSHMSEQQEELLYKINTSEIVLCLDNDEVGKNATKEIAKRLAKRVFFSYTKLPEDYKDVQEITTEHLRTIINERKTIKETREEMPSMNQIKKAMDDASTVTSFRLLTLGNGDQAFVTIVHDGRK